MKQLNQLTKWLIAIALVFIIAGLARAQDEKENPNAIWGIDFNIELQYSLLEFHIDPMRAGFNNALWFGVAASKEIKGPIVPKIATLATVDSSVDSDEVGVKASLLLGILRLLIPIGDEKIEAYPFAAGVAVDVITGELFGILGINFKIFGGE